MADSYNIHANLQLALAQNTIKPIVSNIAKQFANVHINIPVTVGNATKGLSTLQAQVGKATAGVKDLGRSLDATTGKFISFSESVGISTRRFLSFGIAAGVLATVSYNIRNAITAAVEFDHQLVRFKQVGGDSARVIANVAKEISRLGIELGISSKDMSEAAVTLRQAGFSAEQTTKALNVLGKTTLSPTFDDIKSSTEGVIAVFQQFGKNINNLESQFGSLSKVAADFPVESSDLVEAIKRVGGAYATAGGSLEQLIAQFTTIRGTTRESAESIATGMRTILARLQDPAVAHKLHEIGVEVYDLKGQFVGPYEAIKRLHDALINLPTGDIRASSILKDIGGLRQLSRVVPLVYGDPSKAYGAALQGAGQLNKDAATAQEALSVQLNKLKESFLDLFRVISTDSSVRTVISGLISGVQGLANAMRELKPLIPVFLAIMSVKAVSGAAGAFSSFRKGVVSPVKGYSGGGNVTTQHYTSGGLATSDTVPAMLSPGEFVLRKEAAQKAGYGPLTAFNAAPNNSGFLNPKSFFRINAREIRSQRRAMLYGQDSGRGEGDSLQSMASYLEESQINHKKYLSKTLSNPYRGTSPGFARATTIMHKRHLREILTKYRLDLIGRNHSPFNMANARHLFRQAKGLTEGYAEGGIVKKNGKYINTATGMFARKADYVAQQARGFLTPSEEYRNLPMQGESAQLIEQNNVARNMANNLQERMTKENRRKIVEQYHETQGHSSPEEVANSVQQFRAGLPSKEPLYYAGMTQQYLSHKAQQPAIVRASNISNRHRRQIPGRQYIGPTSSSQYIQHSPPVLGKAFQQYSSTPYNFAQPSNATNNSLPTPAAQANPASLFAGPSTYPLQNQAQQAPFQNGSYQVGLTHPTLPILQNPPKGYKTQFWNNLSRNQSTEAENHFNGFAGMSRSHTTYGINNIPDDPSVITEGARSRYRYTAKNLSGQDSGGTLLASSQNAARGILQSQGKFITSIKQIDDTFSKRFFPTFNRWLDNTKKGVEKTQANAGQVQGGMGPIKAGGGRFGAMRGAGLIGLAVAAPAIADYLTGSGQRKAGEKPGAKDLAGSAIGGIASGAITGGFIGGPMGAFVGGLGGTAGALLQFKTAVEDARQSEIETSLSSVNFNAKKGTFDTTGDKVKFSTTLANSIGQGLYNEHETGFTNFAKGKARLERDYAGTGKYKRLELIPEADKKKLSDSVKEMFDKVSQEKPGKSYKQIIDKIGTFNVGGNKYNAGDVLGLDKENVTITQKENKARNEAYIIQQKLNSIMAQANAEFEITARELEALSNTLRTNGEQFATRQQYSDQRAAPLQGQIVASPNNITLGNVGKPGTVAGDVNEFSKQGGGYDQARAQLLDIIGAAGNVKIGDLKPGENPGLAAGIEAQQMLTRSGVGGKYNSQIGENAAAVLGQMQNLPDEIKGHGAGAVADKILGGLRQVKEAGENGNAEAQRTYGARQQAYIGNLNRGFDLTQSRNQINMQGAEASTFIGTDQVPANSRSLSAIPGAFGKRNKSRYNAIQGYLAKGETPSDSDAAFLRKNSIGISSRSDNPLLGINSRAYNDINNEITAKNITGPTFYGKNQGLTSRFTRGISAEERNNENEYTAKSKAFQENQESLTGLNFAGGGTAQEIKDAFNEKQAETDQLRSKRQSAVDNGKGLDTISKFDNAIADSQNSLRSLATAQKNLADNTIELDYAQKKYQIALNAFQADKESRTRDADVYTFGSRSEKMDLAKRENLTQQALTLNPEQFQSLSDEQKKIVYDRVKESEGQVRTVEQYDKYGRYRGQRDVDTNEILQHFRKPAMDILNSAPGQNRLQARTENAAVGVDAANRNKLSAASEGSNMNAQNIAEAQAQLQDNFNKYLQGINQSIAQQMEATNKFLAGSADLTKALNSFNGKLFIERSGQIEVVLNGGQLLLAAKNDIEKEVLETVVAKLEGMIKKGAPAR